MIATTDISAAPALELHGVSAGYEQTTVLRGVSFAAPAAAVTALLGPNGAGKTTLLRVASGLLAPQAGRIVFDGQDVTKSSSHQRARKGLCHIPEGRGIFRSLTVRENLALQARPGREADAIERASSVFPVLGKRLAQVAGTMSGGEQQMLALSRAYVNDNRLVLVDEPSLGLAPVLVDVIFGFLHALKDRGTSLVLVDQFAARALHLADRVYLLNHGEVTFSGSPSEVQDSHLLASYLGTSA